LYEFQHKHYPELFRFDEVVTRNKDFEKMLHKAGVVIVNAKSV